jgi:hypothetical protein
MSRLHDMRRLISFSNFESTYLFFLSFWIAGFGYTAPNSAPLRKTPASAWCLFESRYLGRDNSVTPVTSVLEGPMQTPLGENRFFEIP